MDRFLQFMVRFLARGLISCRVVTRTMVDFLVQTVLALVVVTGRRGPQSLTVLLLLLLPSTEWVFSPFWPLCTSDYSGLITGRAVPKAHD